MNGLAALYNDIRRAAGVHPRFAGRALVFGAGNERAALMLVGEAPGGEEERQGAPFVGKAGGNLSAFLSAVELSREEVYITNVVKVRPCAASAKTGKPVNRPPDKEELAFFTPYLLEEVNIISPRCVVTLGNVALRAVTGNARARVGEAHGRALECGGRQVFPLYHPASVIYNRALADVYRSDIERLSELLRL